MFAGPFQDHATFDTWLTSAAGTDPQFQAVVDRATDRAIGIMSLMRIDPVNGIIEVGNIHFWPLLQRTVPATEAVYLLMRHVFGDLGYRRFE